MEQTEVILRRLERIRSLTYERASRERAEDLHNEVIQLLLQSTDPLIGHAACSTLLHLLRQAIATPTDEECHKKTKQQVESCLHSLLSSLSEEHDPLQLLHVLDFFRRLITSSSTSHHPELIQEEGQENDVTACNRDEVLSLIALRSLVPYMSRLQSLALRVLTREKQCRRDELPMIWLFKVVRGALSTYPPDAEENASIIERDMMTMFCFLGQTWPSLARRVEARRQYLEMALEWMRMKQQQEQQKENEEEDDGMDVEDAESGSGGSSSRLMSAFLVVCEEGMDEEEDDGEGQEQEEMMCSLARPRRRRAELLAYRLALIAKMIRYCVGNERGRKSLGRLIRCPLSLRYLQQQQKGGGMEEEGEGHSAMVEALADHDDLLLEVMNDSLIAYSQLLDGEGGKKEEEEEEEDPSSTVHQRLGLESMFVSFLEKIGSDEKVLLDFLMSNETCALEYLTRLTKHLIWLLSLSPPLQQQAAANDSSRGEHSQSQQQQQGGRRHLLVIVISFLMRLAHRLKTLTSKGLFPYNAAALLARLQQLESLAVSQGLAATQGGV